MRLHLKENVQFLIHLCFRWDMISKHLSCRLMWQDEIT